jgi:hypothetical protein
MSAAFSQNDIQQLAVESQFYKRANPKINGQIFLELLVFHTQALKQQTLDDLSQLAAKDHDIEITKQALHDRFNSCAVRFLTLALQRLLRTQIKGESVQKEITGFNRILIKDSTCFKVDKSLHEVYPISDRDDNTIAAVRIQFEYDVLRGTINDLSIHAFRDQDNQDWKTTNVNIQKDDLIIRDLGYMHLGSTKDLIESCKACVLCRLDTRTAVYVKNNKGDIVKLNISHEHKKMRKLGLPIREFQVLIGVKAQLPMRMVIYDLADEVASARIRKVRKERRRNGSKTIKAETLVRARITSIITNVTEDVLSKDTMYSLYSIRWQIELIFKTWKSILNIDKIKKVKRERFECFLIAKLLQIVMIWQFFWCMHKWWFSCRIVCLSLFRTSKLLMDNLSIIRDIYLGEGVLRSLTLRRLLNTATRYCILETKKGDLNIIAIIEHAFGIRS